MLKGTVLILMKGLDGAGLIVEFEHPNMKDYGRFDAPPVKDGSITDLILCELDCSCY